MDVRRWVLTEHDVVHTRLAGFVLRRLSDDKWRVVPPGHNSIVWLFWHMTRGEDVGVNAVLRGVPEVVTRDGWGERLGVARLDFAMGMTAAEVAAFTAQPWTSTRCGPIAPPYAMRRVPSWRRTTSTGWTTPLTWPVAWLLPRSPWGQAARRFAPTSSSDGMAGTGCRTLPSSTASSISATPSTSPARCGPVATCPNGRPAQRRQAAQGGS